MPWRSALYFNIFQQKQMWTIFAIKLKSNLAKRTIVVYNTNIDDEI